MFEEEKAAKVREAQEQLLADALRNARVKPQIPEADNTDPVRAIREIMDRFRLADFPPRGTYYEPDEPRDVKMAAQLVTQFKREGVADADHWVDPIQQSAMASFGMPVEEIARQVNLQWLQAVTELIQTNQENDPRFGPPSDWTIVCSDHLFEHWTAIENIAVLHNSGCPPWSVYLVRSTEWFREQFRNEPLRFAPGGPDVSATILPFPTFGPKETPDGN